MKRCACRKRGELFGEVKIVDLRVIRCQPRGATIRPPTLGFGEALNLRTFADDVFVLAQGYPRKGNQSAPAKFRLQVRWQGCAQRPSVSSEAPVPPLDRGFSFRSMGPIGNYLTIASNRACPSTTHAPIVWCIMDDFKPDDPAANAFALGALALVLAGSLMLLFT